MAAGLAESGGYFRRARACGTGATKELMSRTELLEEETVGAAAQQAEPCVIGHSGRRAKRALNGEKIKYKVCTTCVQCLRLT